MVLRLKGLLSRIGSAPQGCAGHRRKISSSHYTQLARACPILTGAGQIWYSTGTRPPATSPSGKAEVCKTSTSGSSPLVASRFALQGTRLPRRVPFVIGGRWTTRYYRPSSIGYPPAQG